VGWTQIRQRQKRLGSSSYTLQYKYYTPSTGKCKGWEIVAKNACGGGGVEKGGGEKGGEGPEGE
jgi:hypothetical protein